MSTRYTLHADGLTLVVNLTDDPSSCVVEVWSGAESVRLWLSSDTALRELRRAITAMLDHRAKLTTPEA